MKNFLYFIGWIIIFLILVPTVIVGLFKGYGGMSLKEKDVEYKIETPKTIDVWIEKDEKVKTVDFEEYVSLVVSSEMPYTFHNEALKAQAVAARTYALAKIEKYKEKKPKKHPKAAVCDSTHCQVFKTKKELIASHEDNWEEHGFSKIEKACKETEGELLYYNEKLVMQPLFFSSSGGQTENSEDVFASAVPYLVSVNSPYEGEATHKNEKKEFSYKKIKTAMEQSYGDRDVGEANDLEIKILSRTDGNRVGEIKIGKSIYSGVEVRNALNLSSALFDIKKNENKGSFLFTSSGFGHGVGMSQYGANGMANEGYSYKKILEHFYSGVIVN